VKKVFSILFALVLMLSFSLMAAVPAMAEGDIVFSNYNKATLEPDDDYDFWNSTSPSPEVIEGFITNPGGQWEIMGIKLNAYAGIFMGGGTCPATVRIYTDAAGTSTVSGAEWPIVIQGCSMGDDFSFAVSGVTLDADTTYWFGLEAGGDASTGIGWRKTTDGSHVFELTGNPGANTTVGLIGEIPQITAISVTPTSIDFGIIAPGTPKSGNDITVENIGTVTVVVDAWLDPLTGTVFNYLKLNGAYPSDSGIWDDIISSLLPSESEIITTELDVPLTYSAQGSETARLIFEATAK